MADVGQRAEIRCGQMTCDLPCHESRKARSCFDMSSGMKRKIMTGLHMSLLGDEIGDTGGSFPICLVGQVRAHGIHRVVIDPLTK